MLICPFRATAIPMAGVYTACLLSAVPTGLVCRGFAALHHLPIICRPYGTGLQGFRCASPPAYYLSSLRDWLAGVSLRFTACLLSVVPTGLVCRGFAALHHLPTICRPYGTGLQGFRCASPPAYYPSSLRDYPQLSIVNCQLSIVNYQLKTNSTVAPSRRHSRSRHRRRRLLPCRSRQRKVRSISANWPKPKPSPLRRFRVPQRCRFHPPPAP